MKARSSPDLQWAANDTWHVPYQVFTDPALFQLEQDRIFRGPTWNYVGLEAEVPEPGDFQSSWLGTTPVVVVRDRQGSIRVLVNRCAHKGATVVRDGRGNASVFRCLYHDWSYALDGRLKGVPFQKGVNGLPGYEEPDCLRDAAMQSLQVGTLNGVIFASFRDDVPPLSDYLGVTLRHFTRVFDGRPLEILGYLTERIRANWKLYFENTKDPYHAGLMHHFHSTFGLLRPNMRGEVTVASSGAAVVVSHAGSDSDPGQAHRRGDITTNGNSRALQAPELLDFEWEYGDRITNAIHTIFPSVVTHQIGNSIATRRIVPLSVDSFELHWTFVGYRDDDTARRQRRIRQANLVGPSGFISLEDVEALEVLQRAIADGSGHRSITAMGGTTVEVDTSVEGLINENAVRALWCRWRQLMGV
ncbi:MAG: Rieske 2Fe-2S domain-containing protein [Actinomycetota bacterium]|nr:Rieske 2Fe-2S domain-containing protein [Actinomycetota bacterium]